MINDALIKKLSIVFVIIAFAFAFGYLYSSPVNKATVASEKDLALATAINDCDEITDRAASHLKAIVEFQKLEIIGRKARVFKLCMGDHGYTENKLWLDYSMPAAEKKARDSNISVDEALENIRRTDMKVSYMDAQRPLYWVKRAPKRPE